MAPLLDLLITLLHWGAAGWRAVLAQREGLYAYARQRLQQFAAQHGERVLATPGNPISLALSLASFEAPAGQEAAGERHTAVGGQVGQPRAAAGAQPLGASQQSPGAAGQNGSSSGSSGGEAQPPPIPITFLGSMLFNRCVSGTRVVARGKRQEVRGQGWCGLASTAARRSAGPASGPRWACTMH